MIGEILNRWRAKEGLIDVGMQGSRLRHLGGVSRIFPQPKKKGIPESRLELAVRFRLLQENEGCFICSLCLGLIDFMIR